jgi:hypothetical protein
MLEAEYIACNLHRLEKIGLVLFVSFETGILSNVLYTEVVCFSERHRGGTKGDIPTL